MISDPWKKSIKDRVELFKQYYAMKNERSLLGFFYGSEYPVFRYPFAAKLPKNKALTPDDFSVAAFVEDTLRLFKNHEACGGDFIYAASAFWGIPWLEAMLGCPIYSDNSSGSLYAEKPEKVNLEFSPDNEWSKLMKQMLQALAKASDESFPLATTRMRGVSDLLSAIYGGDEFLFKLMDDPTEIQQVITGLTDLFIDCGKFQLNLIPEFHDGIGSFYYHNWAPAGTIWHQEDAAALLSPDLYDNYIEPADRKIVESFSQVIMHQHSTGFVPTDAYIRMGMFALELHIDAGGLSAEELYQRHLNILKDKPLIIWGEIPEANLDWIFSKLPHQGLAINIVVDSPEQAKYLWSKYVER